MEKEIGNEFCDMVEEYQENCSDDLKDLLIAINPDYTTIDEFLEDNLECMELIVDWIKNRWYPGEWKENLRVAIFANKVNQ